jgi:hypothetical protein
MENRRNEKRPEARDAMTDNLIEAIEQVRLDMAKVELWAYAVSGFARPVAAYEPGTTMWLPPEQAKRLGNDRKR